MSDVYAEFAIAEKDKQIAALKSGLKRLMLIDRMRGGDLSIVCAGCGNNEWTIREEGHKTGCWIARLLEVK
jgi:hypothetical protein